MNIEYTIYVGHSVNGKPTHSHEDVRQALRHGVKEYPTPGLTLVPGFGLDKHGNEEDSSVITIIGTMDNQKEIRYLTAFLGHRLRQEETLLTSRPVQSEIW